MFAYSGIGDGVIFDINLKTGKIRYASAEDLEVDEIMECMEMECLTGIYCMYRRMKTTLIVIQIMKSVVLQLLFHVFQDMVMVILYRVQNAFQVYMLRRGVILETF